jgi:hypothetical protein
MKSGRNPNAVKWAIQCEARADRLHDWHLTIGPINQHTSPIRLSNIRYIRMHILAPLRNEVEDPACLLLLPIQPVRARRGRTLIHHFYDKVSGGPGAGRYASTSLHQGIEPLPVTRGHGYANGTADPVLRKRRKQWPQTTFLSSTSTPSKDISLR